jgi:hypothetical protein
MLGENTGSLNTSQPCSLGPFFLFRLLDSLETEDLRLIGVEARLVEGLIGVQLNEGLIGVEDPVTSSISSNRLFVFLCGSLAVWAFLAILYNLDPTKNFSLLGKIREKSSLVKSMKDSPSI